MPTVTTTVTSVCASGVVATQTTTQATPEPTTVKCESAAPATADKAEASPLVVYNWPMMGRFGAQFLMLDHAGIKYEHIESLDEIISVSSVFGAKTGESNRAMIHEPP